MTRMYRRNRRSRATAQRNARRFRFRRTRGARTWKSKKFPMYSLRGRNPFTQERMSTVLKYNDVISLDANAGTLGSTGSNMWQFCLNGLYDPDTTSTGHQPLFFDNYAALYSKYFVKYATITVTVINHFVNTSIAGPTFYVNNAYKLFILKDATNSSTEFPSNIQQVIEAGGSNIKWRFAGPSLTGKLPKLKMGCAPHKIACRGYRDDTLTAATNANPASAVYAYVGIAAADASSNPVAVSVDVRITYYVDFFDRIAAQAQN